MPDQPAIFGSRTFQGPGTGTGCCCVTSIDYFAALSESSAYDATITVEAGETLVVTGTFSPWPSGGAMYVEIRADGTNAGDMYQPWNIVAGEAITFSNTFRSLSAGTHTIGFYVNGVAITDGPWALTVMHCVAGCVDVHIATGS